MVPELDLCFDIGRCDRAMLAARHVAITHGHMDHVAGLPYYFSQRWFQGMGVGTCICDKRIEPAVRNMMQGWVDLERQQTSHEIIGLDVGQEYEIKNNIFLKTMAVDHTVPAVGYAVVERRTKLREELLGLPQSQLRDMKLAGKEITRELRIPLIAYTGDTLAGPHLLADEFRKARILIIECTFCEPGHRDRALAGKHVHLEDIDELLDRVDAEAVVLTHLSRRTHLIEARKFINQVISPEKAQRLFVLMDHRTNKARYERQLHEAEQNQPQPTS